MNKTKVTKTGNLIGILSVIFFFICMSWGLFIFDPVLKELHINMMKIAYPGFSMGLGGAIIGTIESFIYGWILGALFIVLHKRICR